MTMEPMLFDGDRTLGAPGAALIIISGPSGVGKDTIIDVLRSRPRDPDYHYVITCTTRLAAARRGRRGRLPLPDPRGVRSAARRRRVARGAEVHGNWYGTPRDDVRGGLGAGQDVILKIDVQGAQKVKEAVPDALLVFLVPPSLEALFQRLRSRATETADELEIRQRNAAVELARQGDYDHVVVNETGQVERVAQRIEQIIAAEKAATPDRRIRI